MEQLNRIELRGNVGSVRCQSFNGRKVVHFTVATNYVYKSKDGEPVIETTWHYVSAWEGRDFPDFSRIEKGAKMYVQGRLRMQRYTDNEGGERVTYEIIAKKISVIDSDEQLSYEQS